MLKFKILQKYGKARVGILKTVHGVIETPNFLPVGTQATVKGISPQQLIEVGAQVVMANTYHLMLRPGSKLVQEFGGLHQFMNWQGPVMTDSGGFQVFSLGIALEHGVGKLLKEAETEARPRLNEITEEGVIFQSHLDGSQHILTPEKSIDIQLQLNSDLLVGFDDLESPKHTYKETLKSLDLSDRWQKRSLEKYIKAKSPGHLLYGVTHGGIFQDLRIRSARFVDDNFEGIALGGAHTDKTMLYEVVDWTTAVISDEKPRHLLGIGEVQDLLECVELGIDLFDCVAPTRRARNGSLYLSPKTKEYSSLKEFKSKNYTLNIKMVKFASDKNPIDKYCKCYTCQNFSRAYLHHLYRAKEMFYHHLATIHNLYFILNLMSQIRESIKNGSFKKLKKSYLP